MHGIQLLIQKLIWINPRLILLERKQKWATLRLQDHFIHLHSLFKPSCFILFVFFLFFFSSELSYSFFFFFFFFFFLFCGPPCLKLLQSYISLMNWPKIMFHSILIALGYLSEAIQHSVYTWRLKIFTYNIIFIHIFQIHFDWYADTWTIKTDLWQSIVIRDMNCLTNENYFVVILGFLINVCW